MKTETIDCPRCGQTVTEWQHGVCLRCGKDDAKQLSEAVRIANRHTPPTVTIRRVDPLTVVIDGWSVWYGKPLARLHEWRVFRVTGSRDGEILTDRAPVNDFDNAFDAVCSAMLSAVADAFDADCELEQANTVDTD